MTNRDTTHAQCLNTDEEGRCQENIYGGGRGLCRNHYASYNRIVRRGTTTWEELAEAGKCLKKLSQAEKNIRQMHPHKTYRKNEN